MPYCLETSTSWNSQGLSRPVTGTAFATQLLFLTGRLALFVFHYPLFVYCRSIQFGSSRYRRTWINFLQLSPSLSIRFSDVETSLSVLNGTRQNALKVEEISWELYLSRMHRSDPRFLRKTCSCAVSHNLYGWCLDGCMKKKDVELRRIFLWVVRVI